jgi:hypothetical protein
MLPKAAACMPAVGQNGTKGQKAKGKGRDIWWGLEVVSM